MDVVSIRLLIKYLSHILLPTITNKQLYMYVGVSENAVTITSMSWPYHDTVTVYLPTSNVKLG